MNFKRFQFSDTLVLVLSAALFVIAGGWLFSVSQRALDPDHNKNWWSASFVQPTDSSANFVIANHTATTDFSYQITTNTNTTEPKTISIPLGATQTVSSDTTSNSFRLVIRHNNETRVLTKNLP